MFVAGDKMSKYPGAARAIIGDSPSGSVSRSGAAEVLPKIPISASYWRRDVSTSAVLPVRISTRMPGWASSEPMQDTGDMR